VIESHAGKEYVMRKLHTFFLYLIVFIALFGCSLLPEEDTDVCENVMIFSGDSSLVKNALTPVLLKSEMTGKNSTPGKWSYVKNFRYSITQICRIKPTIVSSHSVQANDIIISGNTAYVAYNTAGSVFDGAIQIIKKFGRKMFLYREIQFAGMDIICLSLHGNKLVFGGMADPDVFDGKRSFIGEIDLKRPKAEAVANSFVYLSSYAVTGIAYRDEKYYVSVGADEGGIHILDKNLDPVAGTLESPDISADDIRDIEAYGSGVIALAGTTDSDETRGRILIVKGTTLTNDIEIVDFNSPEAKATIEVNGDYAYLGLSAKGFQVFDLTSENEIFTYSNPDTDPLHVTNSISYNDNLIFSANGEYGFRILDYTPPETSASIAGFYSYSGLTDSTGQNYSANHIAFKNKFFCVASGAGGVLIYDLTNK
jgi:hypothetical protein